MRVRIQNNIRESYILTNNIRLVGALAGYSIVKQKNDLIRERACDIQRAKWLFSYLYFQVTLILLPVLFFVVLYYLNFGFW